VAGGFRIRFLLGAQNSRPLRPFAPVGVSLLAGGRGARRSATAASGGDYVGASARFLRFGGRSATVGTYSASTSRSCARCTTGTFGCLNSPVRDRGGTACPAVIFQPLTARFRFGVVRNRTCFLCRPTPASIDLAAIPVGFFSASRVRVPVHGGARRRYPRRSRGWRRLGPTLWRPSAPPARSRRAARSWRALLRRREFRRARGRDLVNSVWPAGTFSPRLTGRCRVASFAPSGSGRRSTGSLPRHRSRSGSSSTVAVRSVHPRGALRSYVWEVGRGWPRSRRHSHRGHFLPRRTTVNRMGVARFGQPGDLLRIRGAVSSTRAVSGWLPSSQSARRDANCKPRRGRRAVTLGAGPGFCLATLCSADAAFLV